VKRLLLITVLAAVAASCTPSGDADAPAPTSADRSTTTEYTGESFAGTVDAPEFPEGLEWVNTASPISMNDLKGKVVLLDFWTYGCINCIHILPDLERLEAEFADELVVIGGHSAKFPNEARTGNLRDIVQRYEIAHPVVNDEDFVVWDAWGANAWPTIAVVDPTGRVVGTRAGEGVYEAVRPVIAGLVAEFDAQDAISREPLVMALEADVAPDRPLRYPGKVLAAEGRLWIADTGHHRILEVDPTSGDVLAVHGSGVRGADDGVGAEATFHGPQGLALGDGILYVADTNNHLVRAIDLTTGEVTTVIGTGDKGWPPSSGTLRATALASPWAVAWADGSLYIANAGTHQIWRADVALDTVGPYIGSAREGTLNGSFTRAELAQPSSLTVSTEGLIYFADSESSSIRVGDTRSEETSLVVGGNGSLFDFGDTDGTGNAARLQHPLGTALSGSTLYVADTYNSKIKRVDVATDTVTSWLGTTAGFADGEQPAFNEPGGLSLAGDVLWVADTNNHAIRRVDLATGSTSTLVLKGIERFDPPAAYRGDIVTLPALDVSAGPASVVLAYELPDGYKVNDEAPSSVVINAGSNVAAFPNGDTLDITGTALPASLAISLSRGSGTVHFDVTLIYCEAINTSLCLIDQTRFVQPLTVGAEGASSQITLPRAIPTPGG
jgi:thiol-disulfide isomerase/thioredoxin